MRITQWAKQFGLTVVRAEDRADQWRWTPEQMREPRRLVDVFTTRDGSWEVSDKPGSIEAWARQAYLYPPNDPRYNAQGGGDVNLFVLLKDPDGNHLPGAGAWFWSDGLDKLALKNEAFAPYLTTRDAEPSGWANIPLAASSGYDYTKDRGPWCWTTYGYADVLIGGGLPGWWHVSMFGVWQIQMGAVEPPVEPPVGDLEPRVRLLEIRFGALLELLRAAGEV